MELPELRKPKNKKDLEREDDSELYESSDKETLIKKLRELRSENLRLRQRVWRLQYRGTIPMGIALASTGGISLLFSYLYSSLILTFIGLGLTLWGALIFYVSPSRYVPEEIINAIPLSMIKSLDNLVASMGYKGRTIFLHPKYLKGLTQGYVFIPYDGAFGIPKDEELAKEKLFYDEPKGIFMTAPSQGLVELFERELNVNFATVDLEYIQENLPKLLIEDLKITDELSIENNDGMIEVKMVGGSSVRMCELVGKETQLGNHLGCPLCAALALVISKVMGKPVTIKESIVRNDTIKTTYLTLDL